MRVLIGTTDFEGSCAFYRDILDFPLHEVWDDPDGRGALFDSGAGLIEVVEDSPDHPALPPQGVSIAIEVATVDTLYERLRQLGVAFADPIGDRPWGHRSFSLDDPAGLRLTFFQVLAT
jgi:catechol 2,3-dioxygenase-like lactoylglutathione lyase family enzyme